LKLNKPPIDLKILKGGHKRVSKRRKFELITGWGTDQGIGVDRAKVDKEKFLEEDVVVAVRIPRNMKQSRMKIWTEGELWVRRAIMWDLVEEVVDRVEYPAVALSNIVEEIDMTERVESKAAAAVKNQEEDIVEDAIKELLSSRTDTNVLEKRKKNAITSFFTPKDVFDDEENDRWLDIQLEDCWRNREKSWRLERCRHQQRLCWARELVN
jgi:hypothetical protein